MDATLFGLPWFVWGCLSLVVAAVYVVVWPRPRTIGGSTLLARPLWRHIILRWFHALAWVLLAISFFLRPSLAFGGAVTANILMVLALVTYAIFIGTLLVERVLRR